MDLIVTNHNTGIPLFSHFLLSEWMLSIEERTAQGSTPTRTQVGSPSAQGWRVTLAEATTFVRLAVTGSFVNGTQRKTLVLIQQDLTVDRTRGIFEVKGWKKGPVSDPIGMQKIRPLLHPLLVEIPGGVGINLHFVDITDLFLDWHGSSYWWRALNLLRRRSQKICVLASLGGHPLIWYVVVPDVCAPLATQKPVVMVMPADYGAIYYGNSLQGAKTAAQGKSYNNSQSGLEVLLRLLLEPVNDDRYRRLLPAYVKLRGSFVRNGPNIPPPLHHFRSVLTYKPTGGPPHPEYWDTPCGLERAMEDQQSLLFLPVMNGGEGGVLIKQGLHGRVSNAVHVIYTQTHHLHYDSIDVARPVLMAFSQSGGNVFTAADHNEDGIRGLVLLEPNYMNAYVKGEDRTLTLGRKVISRLLKRKVKVVVCGRHVERPFKYLPGGKTDGIHTLPEQAEYHVLAYPLPVAGTIKSLHPLVDHRYARLLHPGKDVAVKEILESSDLSIFEFDASESEVKIANWIASQRKAGATDVMLVQTVFHGGYEKDEDGAYYPHSLVLTGGQAFDVRTATYRTFLHESLRIIDGP